MKLAGHTMSTPELAVDEAMVLFARLGLSGIELICQEDYKCGIDWAVPVRELAAIRRHAADLGLAFVGLIPYMKDMNLADGVRRSQAINDFKRVVDIAVQLDCPAVRVYAGHELPVEERSSGLSRLVDSLSEIAEYAEGVNVGLNIENHPETMATSARDTMEIIRRLGRDNVGVIYDQANLTLLNREDLNAAIAMQKDFIRHVHVKDFILPDGQYRATAVGEGIIPWQEIISILADLGYDGFYSLEYERRWHPDQLPPAHVGLKRSIEYLQSIAR